MMEYGLVLMNLIFISILVSIDKISGLGYIGGLIVYILLKIYNVLSLLKNCRMRFIGGSRS